MFSVKNIVSTRIVTKLKTEPGAPYYGKKLEITSTVQNTPNTFPTLNVESLGEPQTSNDIGGRKQNYIESTIQLKGYSNSTYQDAYSVVDSAGNIMIGMGYKLIYGIENISNGSLHIAAARFSRRVGSGDIL